MAEGIQGSGQPDDVKRRKVWTFLIHGGEACHLKFMDRVGPSLDHLGANTLWKMVGTKAEADSVKTMLEGPLVGACVEKFTEIETPEMLAIRNERLGKQEG